MNNNLMSKNCIKGFQSISLIDYPDKICSVVFFSGCNFLCGFCHNKDLVIENKNIPCIEIDYVLKRIKKQSNFIDGVCITGGEPTLYNNLIKFVGKIKSMNLKIKLDTNGTMPNVLEKLIDKKLIDYVAMDIKNTKEKYANTVGIKNPDLSAIQKSINIIKNKKIDYEFRTTIIPLFHKPEDILNIAKWIGYAKKYRIQQFRPINTIDKKLEKQKPYSVEELDKIKNTIQNYFDDCKFSK